MTPLSGMCSARMPRTDGSMSAISAGPISRTASPLARPRPARSASRASSLSRVATTSLPVCRYGIWCSSANSIIASRPAVQNRALRLPGL